MNKSSLGKKEEKQRRKNEGEKEKKHHLFLFALHHLISTITFPRTTASPPPIFPGGTRETEQGREDLGAARQGRPFPGGPSPSPAFPPAPPGEAASAPFKTAAQLRTPPLGGATVTAIDTGLKEIAGHEAGRSHHQALQVIQQAPDQGPAAAHAYQGHEHQT